MKICKLKPDRSTCWACKEEQDIEQSYFDCSRCVMEQDNCELVKVGLNIFGRGYAIVIADGKLKKVSMNRVVDIQEVER